MREIEKPFRLEFAGKTLRIAEHELAGKKVLHVDFGTGEKLRRSYNRSQSSCS